MSIDDMRSAKQDAAALREELLRRRLAGGRGGRRSSIGRADRDRPLPLSFGQQQMWFLNRMEPDSAEYVVPLVLRLRGALDVAALRDSWQHLVDRHEILRTRYELTGSEPTQVIDAPRPVDLPVLDLTDRAEPAARDREARELVEREVARPFDLAAEWPVRALLLTLAEDEHAIAVSFHHIACDAWSIRLFANELSALYRSFTEGTPSPLAPLSLQYADFAAWQRETLTGQALEGQLDYWRRQLAGLTPLELPTDRPRPAIRSSAADAVEFAIPAALADRARELGRQHDTTLFTVLLTAFQVLLSRYSASTDIPIGVTVSGRGRPELQQVLGYGINTLVVRGRWDGAPSFGDLLDGTRGTLLEAFDHQAVPFAALVDELQPERDMSRTPLFQVDFVLHEDRATAVDMPGLAVESLTGHRIAKFDLTLELHESADGSLTAQLTYATGLFRPATARRMAEHYRTLLGAALDQPARALAALPMLTEQERASVLTGFNDTAAEYPSTSTLADLVEARVAAAPDAPAVTFGDVTLSYAEFNRRANQIAHRLRELGVGAETVVAVCAERSHELAVAVHGVVKAGAAYLPLDPEYPAERLAMMLGDANAPVLLTQRHLLDRVPATGARSLLLDDPAEWSDQPDTDPQRETGPEHAAYVIYTSGSTGRPKGVVNTHRGIVNRLHWMQNAYRLAEDDVVLQKTAASFDVSVWEFFWPLTVGARLVLAAPGGHRDPAYLRDLVTAEGVTTVHFVSSMLGLFLAEPGVRGCTSLRRVLCSGEALPVDLATRCLATLPAELHNLYGPTEAAVDVTAWQCTPDALDGLARVPIGAPIDNIHLLVLDAALEPVPVGLPGQLFIGGVGVARGYLNRPELTAERFVPDPFRPGRLYATGDLARWRPDGTLDFLGRVDSQVKLRGLRIELGEIEAALREQPDAGEVAVVVRTDGDDQRIVGYLTGRADPTALRDALKLRLPEYMLPAALVRIDALPLSPNGKLDHRALPAPDRSAFAAAGRVAPRNPLEERVAAVWSAVLDVAEVGVEDNFFELGGDSIRAVRLAAELREAGHDVTIRDIFEHRTIAELCTRLSTLDSNVAPFHAVAPFALIGEEDRAALPADVVDAYPLSQIQTGMLVEMLTGTDRNAYVNLNSFRIPDPRPFSLATLRAAAAVVAARHDILRTSMHLAGYSQPLQLVHATAELPLALHDLRGADPAAQDEARREFVAGERAGRFELTAAPLLRMTVHLESDDAWRLTFTQSHAITEGWSLNSLLMEIVEAYQHLRDDRDLPPYQTPSVRYADFVAAELASLDDDGDRQFWQRITDEHAPFVLPAGWGDRDEPGHCRVQVPFADLEEGLRNLAAKARTSLKSVLFAAHLRVLGTLTAEAAFHTGLVCHGRLEATGSDRVLGMHLNTVPFPVSRAARTWRQLVEQTFAEEIEIWGHRRHPLPAIQRAAGGTDRLITVVFDYLDFHQVDAELVDVRAGAGGAVNEFALNVVAADGHLHLTADTGILNRHNTERLAAIYRRVLTAMAADPDGDATAAHLPDGERSRLLTEWNDTEGPTADLPVHQLFEAQAAATPDALAVSCADGQLSYAELNERANQLAHHLLALGLGQDALVGVCLDRGPDLVPTLLGILKSGAAYLPLDPSVPAERLGYQLADTRAAVVLTSADHAPLLAGLHGGELIVLDRERAAISARPKTNPAPVGDLDTLAYVIYTSGSTGTPKGVQAHHRGLANYLQWTVDAYAAHGTGGAPLFSSIAFDLGIPNLFTPLITGQPVHLLPQDLDTADLGIALAESGPYSFIKLTPGHLDLLTHQLNPAQATALAGLVIAAGDTFPTALVERWTKLAGPSGTAVATEYGPTEITIGNSGQPFIRLPDTELTPLGAPIPNTTMYVLDQNLQLVPLGVPGEIHIGGTGLTRGYLGRPDLTADKFVPNPYGPAGSRLYRSGDLGAYQPDGSLDFLGRIDNQVKIRGYRVELGEIQATLIAHPDIRDSVVTARQDHTGQKTLVAYLVAAEGILPDAAVLRDALAATLPDYMIPAAFVSIDRIPLTPNGKTDHRALPAPDRSAFAAAQHVDPRNPTEERLAAVWAEVLGLAQVSVEDNFFDLGGDSIRAVRLAGALREAGYDLGIRDIFEHRTIAGLASVAAEQGEALAPFQAVEPFALIGAADRAALPEDVVDAYPLSQIQTGMLVETLTGADRRSYHNLNSFRIPDRVPFSLPALRRAVDIVTARHDILRTSMHLDGYAQLLQLVHASLSVPIAVHDLRGQTERQQERAGLDFADRERAALFDLAAGPLLRVAVHLESDEAWRLTFTQSHAITEGWSYHSMLMELLDAYHHLRDGRDLPPYDAPAVRYADFVAAELTSLADEGDKAFWRNITNHHAPLALPTGWGEDGAAERYRVQVPLADVEDGLRALAGRARVSLKSVLLAAHLTVMGGLTGETAFHTGLVCHGRLDVPGGERVLGMHLNTLPFPVSRTARTWRQLVEQAFAVETELWAHRRYPLPAIQRDTGATDRLLSVMFDYIDFHHVDTALVDVAATLVDGATEFALHVSAAGGHLNLISSTDVISHRNAERLAAMYGQVLRAMAADPDGDATGTYLPPAERAKLLADWNPVAKQPLELCVHRLFEDQVAETPDAVAVVFDGAELTYAELNDRANQLAHHLRALGAGPDTLVGVCLERGADLMPTLLGVLKSGAAYLPLDPANPADRLNYVLADAAAPILVTRSDLAGRFTDSYRGDVVVLDRDRDTVAAKPTANPASASHPDNLIYVIYTSGSTGRPKGVSLTHGNVARLFTSTAHQYGFGVDDVWSLFHSYAFDVSVWEMWGALLHGGRLVVVPAEVTRSPEEFLDLLVANRVTILSQTPSAFRGLVSLAADGDPRIDRLALRAVVFGGERLEFHELRPWAARVGLATPSLVNMYGITETTVHSTFHLVTEEDLGAHGRSPIGRPISDLSVHLLDPRGNLVPVGVPGEIHVGGDGVARGYLNRPDLTAEKFVPDPFGPAGSRLYRSGDLARRLPDGTLEFLGRIDTQVKIRGYRIELGEIQAAVAAHPDVRDAVVIAREDQPGEKTLAAYLVAEDGRSPRAAELRGHLADTLPDYMVPAAFVLIDRIPLTVNGKLDHRALPAPDRAALATAAHVPPRNPVEERIAAVWCAVLGLPQVSVEDNFFALGGDSIRAVRLAGALREAGYDVAIPDLFAHRTIAALGALVGELDAPVRRVRAVAPFELIGEEDRAALPADVVDAYPLSQVQIGMLVETITGADRQSYHNLNSFRLPDERPFSLAALRRAVDLVSARHDILRTSMHLTGYSQPLQLVHATAELPLVLHDLRGAAEDEVHRAGLDFLARERATGFELTAAPLLRLNVHLGSDDAWRLTFTQSHTITEGWSLNSLLMEIVEAYQHLRDDRDLPPYDAPAVRYADFVAAELASLTDERDHEFWQRVTDEHAPLALPASWRDNATTEPQHLRVPFGDLADGLRDLAAQGAVSLKSVLLAAHLKVMATLTNEPRFHTGLVLHGRLEAVGGERVLGMHLNTVPLPHNGIARSWRQLVADTFAQETLIWAHRRYPLPAIQRASGVERLVTVLFDYLDFHQVDSALVDAPTGGSGAVNEFALNVIVSGGHIGLTFGAGVLGTADAARLAATYRAVLAAMAADPDGDATGTHLATEDRAALLAGGAGATVDRPAGTVVDLFEAQAAATPDALAVSCADGRLSYAELDTRANQVAQHLAALDIEPDALVGVCLDRGPDLVPTLLGILKSGAAYLPLDPSVPAERLRYQLADTGARVVVSTSALADRLLADFGGTLVLLDRERAALAARPVAPIARTVDPDSLAYVIYTSGSTGTPKGVQAHHRGLANYLQWTVGAYAAHGTGGAPLFSSIAFDLGIPNLFTPLITGQPVHLLPQDLDTADLGTALAESGPYSFIKLTPGHLDLLTHQLNPAQANTLAGLVIAAGDTFPTALVERWQQLAGPEGTAVATEYGPTEITIGNSGQPITRLPDTELTPLGDPIPNSTMYVLDAGLNLVQPGVPGEIHIGGTGLTRGYLGRPDLTADKFVPNPYGPAGSRLYRTGDLGRILADGSLDFLGRIDNQVKIRGYRVELGEIQAALTTHPDIRDAVVTARQDHTGQKALVAYVIAEPSGTQDASALRAHLAGTLPDYMIPTAFVPLDRIPLTVNGKVDLRALPAPDRATLVTAARLAPRNPVEERIAAVWAEVLGLTEVSVEDNFFDLGGDSIRAVRLAGALREAGYDLGIREIFEHRTIAGLGVLAAGQDGPAEPFRAVLPFSMISDEDRAALPDGVVDAYPLSLLQTGMLVEMLADSERRNYLDVSFYRIPDEQPFSLPALTEAARIIALRHDILRTSVALTEYSQPLQLVHETADIPIAFHDLRGIDPERQLRAGAEFMAAERAEGFDLATAPLLRIGAYLESDESWRLSFTHCHAVTEGWSMHSLTMELIEAYHQIRDGRDLPPYDVPAVRYADFIAAELTSLGDDQDQAFWQDITDHHTPLALPTGWGERNRPREPHRAQVPYADLEDSLRALAARANASVKSVLLAAHLQVMSALHGEAAFHTGLVYHCRLEAAGGERVLGMHLNTLPFPHIRTAGTWLELVERVFAQETQIWAHRRYPLPAVQRASGSTERLISVVFEFLDFHQVDTEKVDVAAEYHAAPNEFALNVTALGGQIYLATGTDVLSREFADRLAAMYREVLEAMAADPTGRTTDTCLPAAERARILAAGSTPAVDRPATTVVDLIEAQAAATPDAVAVVFGDSTLTYRELDRRANRIARHLGTLGAGPDVLVGVCLDRGLDLVPTLLGVWKSGAAYLPLDPTTPVERLRHMLSDTATPVLVTQAEHAEALGALHAGELVVLDEDRVRDAIAANQATRPDRVIEQNQLAYVIYTSGSTGKPKGVLAHHAGLANYLLWTVEAYAARGTGGAPLFSPISFDLGIPDLFTPLITGQAVHLLPQDLDTADLGAALAEAGPFGFVKLTPAHLDLLAHQLTPAQANSLAGLVIAAGDAFPATLVERWRRLAGPTGTPLATEYGPTEITIGNSGQPIDQLPDTDLIPLGDPIPNTTMHVLDPFGHLAPFGVPGEVCIGGVGVTRGYLNQPALTAERFVPDPFGPPGSRLYRSGDLGQRRVDGTLETLGRADTQLKIRGYRIELGEIQAALTAHPGIRDAVVVAREDQPGQQTLVAYLVGENPPDADELRDRLAGTLPDYMIPAAFLTIERIPLTVNGKLDRRALPAPDRGALTTAQHVAPRTPTEQAMAAVWADVLGVADIGVEDNFFELGGDSIRALRLTGALREAGYEITIRDVFEHRTIAELSAVAAEQGSAATPYQAVAPFALISEEDRADLPPGVVDAYPLSQIQTGMLVEMLSDSERNTYHSLNSFRIPDQRSFSAPALRRAVDLVAARHDTLRTSMHLATYSQPLQLVHAVAEIPIAVHDLRGIDPVEQERIGREYVERERATLFDLDTAPLLRIGIHLESDAAWRLSFTHCNAITEGWSYHSLLMEIIEAYQHLLDGEEPPPYEAPSVRYADYVAAELESLASQEDQSFWQRVTDRHAPMAMPEDWGADGPAEPYRLQVPIQDLETGLRSLAAKAKVSLKSVLLAAHLKVMSTLTTERAFHVGLVCHGRLDAPGADRVLGMHLNTLPFPHITGAATWLDLARQVFDKEIEVWGHRRYPLPAIQSATGNPQRLITVMLEYHDFHQIDTDQVDVSAERNSVATDFAFHVIATAGALNIISSTDLVSHRNADRLAAMYREVLLAMAADPDGDATGDCLPPAERAVVLAASAATVPERPVTLTLHEIFAQRAAATPDAVAVVCGDDRLTYAELNASANRIAHHLRSAGAGPGTLVGLCVDRGPDLMPTLLGILKAGAAYLSLDPANPIGRLAQILRDTKASVVVTTAGHAVAVAEIHDGELVVLDDPARRAAIDAAPATDPVGGDDPANLAYVLYTSGSTGVPKGVCVTHANIVRLFNLSPDEFTFDSKDVWALFHSYAFDFAVWEMWGALLHGARLVVVPAATARSPQDLLDVLVDHQVTVLGQTPTAFRGLAGLAQEGDPRIDKLALRAVVFAGERIDMAELQPWVRRLGLHRPALVNLYGITETSVFSTRHQLGERDLAEPGRSLIGAPFGDQRVYVLDGQRNLAPLGVPGEIHIGGASVAPGYFGRPDLTAERFVPDPFGPAGSRLYRSGDLAKRLPDGAIEFLGRIDTQVKIRGYRIELGEITARLRQHPGVSDGAVVARTGEANEKSLVAYVVGEDERIPEVADLRDHLAATLPEYMIPTAFVGLRALPLNTNGKLDHRALPAPDRAAYASTERVAPRTPIERRLAEVWADVLGLAEVSVEDNFFDLGGDSMRAVRLLPAANRVGVHLSVWMIYQAKTLAELAALASLTEEPAGTDPVPLTPPQLRAIEDTAGSSTLRLTLSGRPDPALLEDALRDVVARHDALRLLAHPGDRTWTTAPADAAPADLLRVVRLDAVPVDGRPAAIEAAVAEARGLLDSGAGRLLAATLFHFDNETLLNTALPPELWLTAHDLAVDGDSWRVLVADLNAAYRGLGGGAAERPVEAGVSFRRWAAHLAEASAQPELVDQAHHWLNRLPGAELPQDHPAGGNTHGESQTVTATLSPELTAALCGGDLPEAALLAALGRVLASWSGGDRIDVEVTTDPRHDPAGQLDLTRTVGPLADSYPLALWLPRNRELPALLRSVSQQLAAVPTLRHGYGLLRHLAPDPDLAADLAAQQRPSVGFTFTPLSIVDDQGSDALVFLPPRLSPTQAPDAHRPRLLDIHAHVYDSQLYVQWTHSAAIHEPATIRRLADEHVAALAELLASPEHGATRAAPKSSDAVADGLVEAMARHDVPGASLAVIRDGEIVAVRAYGRLAADRPDPVTSGTLFAAGSISKHVTTVGLLRLAGRANLDLDEDVNNYLTSWRIPGDPAPRVTLRHLLSHSAGFAVDPPFRRYAPTEPLPTVLDILTGRPPAVAPHFDHAPGEVFAMTAVNFSVIQQLMEDVSGQPFPALMRELVLDPLGMTGSDFDPDFPKNSGNPVAHGHERPGVPVPEGYQVMPETAAAGLWTTAGDLARLAVAVRGSYLDHPDPFIDPAYARQMLSPQSNRPYGWSTIIDNTGVDLEIGHGGQATGYQAMFGLRVHSGVGFVLLTNATTGREVVSPLLSALWPSQDRLNTLWQQANEAATAREQRERDASGNTGE
ncbi:amino acid adenylation domain-containing protein [Solihabitans fulvus]|uniref:Amino acid adenylation domain-containing protein n=1 Tax=Solihabitans fulvus TaxID=1892852 RepID=A0A5B2X2R6_9PSEU|nr:non-ribosomal peptide synthase/polyketide synthase [Solihabitans fulvus]KAA2257566.1 amino acid adenylation domain-containing protein [Solihabitans fulvus]